MNITLSNPSIRYWIYTLEGLILVPTNGLIFLTILHQKALRNRKEFTLIGALAFIDAIEGMGTLMAGVGRNWLIANEMGEMLVSRRHCLLQPWNWPWIFNQHVCDATLLAISIERLIAVAWPLFHYGLTITYSQRMLLCAWCPGMIGCIYVVYATLDETEAVLPIFCFTAQVYSQDYLSFLFSTRVLLSTSSVLLYLVIIVLHWRQGQEQLASQGPQFKQYLKSERHMTVTLGLSCLFTSIFYVLPVLVRMVASYLGLMETELALQIVPYSYIVENVNRMLNILLYSVRHKNLRNGARNLLACKQINLTSGAVNEKRREKQVQSTGNPAISGRRIAWN